jgi:hypothetical protein
MYNNAKRTRHVPLPKRLDSDFGEEFPREDEVDIYLVEVIVGLETSKEYEYCFLAILPESNSIGGNSENLLREVLNDLLSRKERFFIRQFSEEMAEAYASKKILYPILSFDPATLEYEKIDFLWLKPPLHLTN